MGYFNRSTSTHRISLEPFDGSGNWVDIKAARSYGDKLKVQNASMRFEAKPSGNGAKAATTYTPQIDLASQRLATLETAIVAWSLAPDHAETLPMPLTRESFELLDERLGEWLSAEIEAYYDARLVSEGDRGNSPAPSNGRSPAEALSQPSSHE